jgi:hypothetical protein
MSKFCCINCFDFVEQCGHTELENVYPIPEVKIEDARPPKIYYTYASKEQLLEVGAKEETIFEDISELSRLCDYKDVEKLNQVELTPDQCHKLIPQGSYCYTRVDGRIKACPFWNKIVDFPSQDNGYCHYMKKGDWQGKGIGLLWDQCKECGVNEYQQDYEEF